jgi:hypothetical protein
MSKIKKKFLAFSVYEQSEVDTLLTTTSGDIVGQIVTDHGNLDGLSGDDHTQYLRTDGTRQLSGTWNYGAQTISGTGNIYTDHVYASCGGGYTVNHIQMYHSGALGIIETGAGSIKLKPANNIVSIETGGFLATEEIRASSSSGLSLKDDGGNLGVFVEDGGKVGIGGITNPSNNLDVKTTFGIWNSGETRGIVQGWQSEYADWAYYNGSGWTYPMAMSDLKSNMSVGSMDGWVGIPNLSVNEVQAGSASGLKLTDDSGTSGIFIEDGGKVGVGMSTPSEQLDVAGNLMLSGQSDTYIKGDTKNVSNNSAVYVKGAGTVNSSVISIGTGATSTGLIYAMYGGVWTSNYISMHHSGTQGHIVTGAGDLKLNPVGNVQIANGKYLFTDEIRARDVGGLYLRDDAGNLGMFIEDGGQIGFGTSTPGYDFHFVKSNSAVTTSYGTLRSELSFSGNVAGGNVAHYAHVFQTTSTVVGTQTDGTRYSLYGVYIDSNVSTPGNIYQNFGLYAMASHSHTTNANSLVGGNIGGRNLSTGTVAEAIGVFSYAQNNSTGTITNAYGSRGEVWGIGAGTVTNGYGVYSKVWRNSGTITNGFLFYGTYTGTVGTKWGIYLTGETKSYISGQLGIGGAPPVGEELYVAGDIHCTGKLTSDLGNDPPYVLYDSETRQSIVNRIKKEVPTYKLNGVVLFYNNLTSKMELFNPIQGIFRSLIGDKILETVDPIIETYETKDYYYLDKDTGEIKTTQGRVKAKAFEFAEDCEIDNETGKFYKRYTKIIDGGTDEEPATKEYKEELTKAEAIREVYAAVN